MNPNGNPLVQEVGLDLDTCLKTGRAVWTFGHTPYRIYPINTRSRREKKKQNVFCSLSADYRCCIGSTSRLKDTSNLPPVTGPSHQATRMRGIFFGQVECCPQPFIRFTQRLYRLFYVCCFAREDRNNYEGRLLRSKLLKSFDVRILAIGNKHCKKNISQS